MTYDKKEYKSNELTPIGEVGIFLEGRLDHPVGELGAWPSGEMNQNKTKSIQENQKKQIERTIQDFKKAEPVVKTRKVQVFR